MEQVIARDGRDHETKDQYFILANEPVRDGSRTGTTICASNDRRRSCRCRSSCQCLRVDVLADLRHFAVVNGNGEHPVVLERFIGGYDSSLGEADNQNPVSLRDEFTGLRQRSLHRFGLRLKQIR